MIVVFLFVLELWETMIEFLKVWHTMYELLILLETQCSANLLSFPNISPNPTISFKSNATDLSSQVIGLKVFKELPLRMDHLREPKCKPRNNHQLDFTYHPDWRVTKKMLQSYL